MWQIGSLNLVTPKLGNPTHMPNNIGRQLSFEYNINKQCYSYNSFTTMLSCYVCNFIEH